MSNQPQTPYIGSKISLISMLDIRYEGILYQVNSEESTIALSKVRSFGTEDRPSVHPVPARDDVYDYIIFKASDIKDLVVCESTKPSNGPAYDPAIISVSYNNNTQNLLKKETIENAVLSKPTDEISKWSQQTQKQPTNNNQTQDNLGHNRGNTDSGGELGQKKAQKDNSDSNGSYRQRYYPQNPYFNHNNDNNNNNENRNQNNPNNNYNKSNRNIRSYHNQNNCFQNVQQRGRFKFDNDFDFEKANEKFKEQLGFVNENLSNVKIQGEENIESSIKSGSSSIQNENVNEIFYNKSTSFFDSISCEALEKNEGKTNRPDWKKERMTNQETFGHSAVRSLAYRRGQRGPPQNNRSHNINYQNQQQNYGNYQRRNFHQNNNQQRQNFNTGSNNNNSNGYRYQNNNQLRQSYGNKNYHNSTYSNQNYHGSTRRYNQQNRVNDN